MKKLFAFILTILISLPAAVLGFAFMFFRAGFIMGSEIAYKIWQLIIKK